MNGLSANGIQHRHIGYLTYIKPPAPALYRGTKN